MKLLSIPLCILLTAAIYVAALTGAASRKARSVHVGTKVEYLGETYIVTNAWVRLIGGRAWVNLRSTRYAGVEISIPLP